MKIIRTLVMFITLLFLWELIVRVTQLPAFILPSPVAVFEAAWSHAPLLLQETKITAIESIIGLISGSLIGIFLALSMALFEPLRRWLLPMVIISQAIPIFALAPLLVIWLGYGIVSKITVIALMLFFPVASAFFDGLLSTSSGWLELGKTMNATQGRILWHLRVPAALPSLATGLRMATIMAPLGAVLGEWVGASSGLGFLMLNANARLDIALVFSALFALIVFSLLLYASVNYLLNRL